MGPLWQDHRRDMATTIQGARPQSMLRRRTYVDQDPALAASYLLRRTCRNGRPVRNLAVQCSQRPDLSEPQDQRRDPDRPGRRRGAPGTLVRRRLVAAAEAEIRIRILPRRRRPDRLRAVRQTPAA